MFAINAMKSGPYFHLLMVIIVAIISLNACSTTPKPDFCQNITVTLNGNKTLCIDIQGYVLGDINSSAQIYLYWLDDLDFEPVMQTVNDGEPIQACSVNEAAQFNFTCLGYGQYVVAVPSTSYRNSTVGSPLVYKFKNENASIDIVFQGGNYDYLVGVFKIGQNRSG